MRLSKGSFLSVLEPIVTLNQSHANDFFVFVAKLLFSVSAVVGMDD